MGFFHEFDQVVVGAEAGVNAVKVNDVVTAVYPAGYENRVKPYGSYSEFFDVIEFRDNASDVADSVSVRILERGRVDLINHCIFEPRSVVIHLG